MVKNADLRRGWVLALLALAQLITSLDFNIVYVALPAIGRDLGFSAHSLQWVISGYTVTFGGFLLLGGRASDLLGQRRVFLLALALYAGSSLAGGLAPSPGVLVGARTVQGLGGALLFPSTLTLIHSLFAEGRERNRALAAWGGAGASGLTLGALLGGVLTDAFGWSAVFYVNVLLAGAAVVAALRLLPADGPRVRGRSIDLPGALTVTGGVSLLVLALVEGPQAGWASASVVGPAVAAALLLAGFVAVERASADPLMALRMLRNQSLRIAMAITAVFFGTLMTLPYFLTLYFQNVLEYSPLRSGLAFLLPSVVIGLGTQLGEPLVHRLGMRRSLAGGLATASVGVLGLAAAVGPHGTYLALVPGIVVFGVGQGVAWTSMWVVAADGVAPAEQGVASGMASTTMQIGGAVGLAVLIAVASSGAGGARGVDPGAAGGIRSAIVVAGVALAGAALVALRLRVREHGLLGAERQPTVSA
jgi:EmrB/QacA subfamily drug resistance transporter